MSLRLEMLQVARLAPKLLGESTELVRGFLRSQLNSDGGFKNRTGASDLYYTVFGLDGLIALQAAWPTERVSAFLDGFGDGEGLDFVHLCCLARCRAAITAQTSTRPTPATPSRTPDLQSLSPMLRRLEHHRARDGGYHPLPGSEHGTAYGAFLALGAYQDLHAPLPDSPRLAQSLNALRTADGAWTNDTVPHS
ncbi:MAG: hypothetical protein KGS61_18370, partial [Verrucomicrobia bacterium]|nr:hypothetical protein [Verrucomicrobiota bacterium]